MKVMGSHEIKTSRVSISPMTVKEEIKDDDIEENVEEGRMWKTRRKAREPTDEERRIHRLTHIPFRIWCEDCVAGRGRSVSPARSWVGEEAQEDAPTPQTPRTPREGEEPSATVREETPTGH